MALVQAVTIGLLALIVTPGYLFYFDVTAKLAVLLAGTAVALAWGGFGRPANRGWSLVILLSLLSLGISTALSSRPGLAATGTNWRRFGALPQAAVLLFAWLVSQHIAGRPERQRVLLRAIAWTGGISAIYGIAQYFGWDPILPAAAYHIGEGIWTIVRPPGTLGYVSYFATWLLGVTFLGLALSRIEESAVWRRVAVGAAVVAAIAMLLTGTRAAVLGLAAGAALGLYRSGFRVTRRVLAGAALVAAAGVGFYFSPWGWNMRSRTRWFIEDPWGGARPNLWRDSLSMSAARLATGYGPEVFTETFPRFESKPLARAYPDFLHESPHNIFLDALVAQGLPGLLVLLAVCAFGLRRARAPGAAWVGAAFLAMLVAQQFTAFTLATALLLYVTAALAAGRDDVAAAGARPTAWGRAAAVPVAAALVYLAVRFTVADRHLARVQHALTGGQVAAVAQEYGKYEQWRVPGTSADLWYSRTLMNTAMQAKHPVVRYQAFQGAADAAARATSLAEDPFDAWYSLAEIYAAGNDPARTETALRAAIAASPKWFKPHWALAQLLRLQARMEEAETEAALAADLNAGKHAEVSRTLAEIRAQRAALLPQGVQR